MKRIRSRKSFTFNPPLLAGILIILFFVGVALLAPLLAPPEGENPYEIPKDGFGSEPQPPSSKHLLGTTSGQYDVFYSLVWGTQAAFKIGLTIALGRGLIGIMLGLAAGFYGGALDGLLMRLTDAFMAIPLIAAAMLMLILAPGVQPVLLTLIIFGWMPYAVLLRGNVLAERDLEYIQAAVMVGVGRSHILFRHLLPNVTRGVYAMLASDISMALIWVTTFYFIGLLRPPGGQLEADWGQMLITARDWIVGMPSEPFKYWYAYLPASLMIIIFSLGWSFLGDGLADVMDPRQR